MDINQVVRIAGENEIIDNFPLNYIMCVCVFAIHDALDRESAPPVEVVA